MNEPSKQAEDQSWGQLLGSISLSEPFLAQSWRWKMYHCGLYFSTNHNLFHKIDLPGQVNKWMNKESVCLIYSMDQVNAVLKRGTWKLDCTTDADNSWLFSVALPSTRSHISYSLRKDFLAPKQEMSSNSAPQNEVKPGLMSWTMPSCCVFWNAPYRKAMKSAVYPGLGGMLGFATLLQERRYQVINKN